MRAAEPLQGDVAERLDADREAVDAGGAERGQARRARSSTDSPPSVISIGASAGRHRARDTFDDRRDRLLAQSAKACRRPK
jgi:hypothetical protein